MKKISTLFKKDPNNLGRVINEIDTLNEWVLKSGIPTQKFDGTACAIINDILYKRCDAKRRKKDGMLKTVPDGAIICQELDEKTGHFPHWIPCLREDNSNKYHFEAFDNLKVIESGTYELCGEKVQGNPEKINGHCLIKHGLKVIGQTENHLPLFSTEKEDWYDVIQKFLQKAPIEGIVFHERNGNRMCKIRKSDFGIKRV